MNKSIGYYGGDYSNPAIAQFSHQFETEDGVCLLHECDRTALTSVLGLHGWGLHSGLADNFWENVDNAIGDGIGTSMETELHPDGDCDVDKEIEDRGSSMWRALLSLQTLEDPSQCRALLLWLLG